MRHCCAVACAFVFLAAMPLTAQDPTVDFSRDIQPILSDRCYKCHGPDEAKREADLRLDREESALAERDGKRAIVPGDLKSSELYRRITSDDADERMPPPDSKLSLTPREIELLRRWIAQGAKWGGHWAFTAPVRPPLPQVRNPAWTQNAIDYFILQRLEQEGLSPSLEADRTMLIRRVTLDLTGLPPTPEEVDAFLADDSPNAYERLVDRLLASPRYGEHMALAWLDAARYADTSGYQNDGPRHMWRWRDWVIDALNANMPFDQFTVEQLAGDLLPNATLEQRIATGFNRNHRGNAEGGIIPEEYAVEYVVDRVDTTATVWMGLTLGCTRCHDHKYDPFTQEEFYRLYAYFNSIPEHGRAIKEGNSPPYVAAPTRQQQAQLTRAKLALDSAQRRYRAAESEIAAAQAEWEKTARDIPDWGFDDGLVAVFRFDGKETMPFAVRDGEPAKGDGVVGQAMQFDGRRFADAGDVANFGYFDEFTLAVWIRPDKEQGGTILSRMTDESEGDGYSVVLKDGTIQVLLVKRWLDDSIRVETEKPVIVPDRWQHVAVTYDGSRLASGIKVYIDGQPQPLKVQLDAINQTFATKEPLRIGAGNGPQSRFRGAIDEVRIFRRALTHDELTLVATADHVRDIAALAPAKRTPNQHQKLQACFLRRHAPESLRQLLLDLETRRKEHDALVESVPNVMVMQELDIPRPTHVLVRGQYDRPGKPVEREVPGTLPPLKEELPNNRLGLALWLVDPAHPLTARVAVNRQWQAFFGSALVRTPEDFGTQGQRPTHPELLDYLATQFIANDWNVKHLQRMIVTSATYRQSSRVTPELAGRDSENRLLARGPRVRLSAQALRDQALFASGLLVEQSGGPSVKPYQPPGLWEELANQTYEQGHGVELYRRSLYTYWKRTAAAPAMMTFDASDRETCVVRRSRTNTPLQALTLLNEVTFVEAARMLAERVVGQTSSPAEADDAARLTLLFRLATSRRPTESELALLEQSLAFHRANFAQHPDAAEKLLSVGEAKHDPSLDKAEIAAYSAVANLVLNLDEVITKE